MPALTIISNSANVSLLRYRMFHFIRNMGWTPLGHLIIIKACRRLVARLNQRDRQCLQFAKHRCQVGRLFMCPALSLTSFFSATVRVSAITCIHEMFLSDCAVLIMQTLARRPFRRPSTRVACLPGQVTRVFATQIRTNSNTSRLFLLFSCCYLRTLFDCIGLPIPITQILRTNSRIHFYEMAARLAPTNIELSLFPYWVHTKAQ